MDCLSKINNTQLGDDKDIDVVMSMYDLMEYNNIFFKKIQEVYVDLALNNGSIADFPGAIDTDVKWKKNMSSRKPCHKKCWNSCYHKTLQ